MNERYAVQIGELSDIADRLCEEATLRKFEGEDEDFCDTIMFAAKALITLVKQKADRKYSSAEKKYNETKHETFQKGDRVLIDRNDKCVVLRKVDGVQKKIELPPNSIDHSLID